MQPTVYEALKAKLGREPTSAELNADMRRIMREAMDMVRTNRVPKLAPGGVVVRK